MTIDAADRSHNESTVRRTDDTMRRRDAQTVSSHQVHFTAVDDFVDELNADHRRGWITDSIVRLAITSRPATLGEIHGTRDAGDERISLYDAKHVEASYVNARRQLVKLSRWCGAAPPDDQTSDHAVERRTTTAHAVLEALHKLQAALARLDGLDVRGGGLYVEEGNWRAALDQTIEAPPTPVCATCGVPLHYANDAWRDADAQPEIQIDTGRKRAGGFAVKRLDHIHDPEVAGRMV